MHRERERESTINKDHTESSWKTHVVFLGLVGANLIYIESSSGFT